MDVDRFMALAKDMFLIFFLSLSIYWSASSEALSFNGGQA